MLIKPDWVIRTYATGGLGTSCGNTHPYSITAKWLSPASSFPAFAFMLVFLFAAQAQAGKPEVVDAKARVVGGGYGFSVTVRHADEGWKHYADRWEIIGPENRVLGVRVLLHPHVNEQPFTRSLSGVTIPPDVKAVTIRVHDLKHGYGKKGFTLALPGR